MVLTGSPGILDVMSDDQITDVRPEATGGRRLRSTLLAAGAAVGMTLAGLGVAQAQTDDSADSPPANEQPAGPEAKKPFRHHVAGGKGHHKLGPGMGIHGEAVTHKPGGGYQTIAHQVGKVTSVAADRLEVLSEDGFKRSYVVNDDTLVNAGNNGIADVQSGDEVRVTAIVENGQARAVAVNDGTRIRQSRERWMPPPRLAPAPAPAPSEGPGA